MTSHARVTAHMTEGRTVDVTPGEWDDDVTLLYQEGGCLAYAVAAAEVLGPDACVAIRIGDAGELSHAFAHLRHKDQGWLVDSYGWETEATIDYLYELDGEDLEHLDTEEARTTVDQWVLLPPQNFALAATFARHVLENVPPELAPHLAFRT